MALYQWRLLKPTFFCSRAWGARSDEQERRSTVMTAMTRLALAVVTAMAVSCGVTQASVILFSPDLPPLTAAYVMPNDPNVVFTHKIFYDIGGGNVLEVTNIKHYGFTATYPPPQNVGDTTTHSFGSTLEGDAFLNGGPAEHFFGITQVTVDVTKVGGPNGTPYGTFDTEMTQLSVQLTDGSLIRESPTLASTGQTQISDAGNGLYRIDSFFDIFTELSLDGGNTWIPGSNSGHVDAEAFEVPEPACETLLGIGAFGFVGMARRRKSAAS
jgi:hypothetical protein